MELLPPPDLKGREGLEAADVICTARPTKAESREKGRGGSQGISRGYSIQIGYEPGLRAISSRKGMLPMQQVDLQAGEGVSEQVDMNKDKRKYNSTGV